ncbi:MAG: molecular chaperone TorD family protein [Anaerolineales bacterium]|nr:molecular chaperone TorD family protein [Anaerolineales bacterium]
MVNEYLNREALLESLAGEILFLDLLGKLWITYPADKKQDWFLSLLDQDLFSEVPFAEEQLQVKKGIRLICEWIDDVQGLPEKEIMLELKTDYSGLFNCANDIIAPPWESVYRDKHRLVKQDHTLKVRRFYKENGLVLSDLQNEPDDHIGYELLFTAYLTRKMARALEQDDQGAFQTFRRVKGNFLKKHLLQWAPIFSGQVDRYAKTKFYQGLSWMLLGISRELADLYRISLLTPEELEQAAV